MKNKLSGNIAVISLSLLAWLPHSAALAQKAQHGKMTIYVSPNGSDSADGSKPGAAFATVQAAVGRAEQALQSGYSDVFIEVQPGRYVAQSIKTSGAGEGKSLSISRKEKTEDRPVFDGGDNGATWLTVSDMSGKPANLTIFGLKVTNYLTAITLNGSRNKLDRSVNHVTIRNNVFDTVGQSSAARGGPSTAAIRFVNGDDNDVINNRFVNIVNVQKCGLLHAVYVAHNSTNNTIRDNEFESGCGDAIRFRDGSNNNRVSNNSFKDAWAQAPISDWYCEGDNRDDCTKKSGECPSVNNVLEANRMVADKAKDQGLVKVFGANVAKSCPDARSERFIVK